jgi:hypothetical protein
MFKPVTGKWVLDLAKVLAGPPKSVGQSMQG